MSEAELAYVPRSLSVLEDLHKLDLSKNNLEVAYHITLIFSLVHPLSAYQIAGVPNIV